MLKIIIPLAGPSEVFSKSGYLYPKPLIEISGKPMIEWVIDQFSSFAMPNQLVFIIKEEDALKYHIDNTLRLLAPSCEVVLLKRNTSGGLCSVLMAIEYIGEDDEIIIINGDQIIDFNFNEVYSFWEAKSVDAGLMTFKSVHPRWSYALIDDGLVIQTAEKNPISYHAIAGYYYFKNAGVFFKLAFEVIKKDVQLDGKFYISPVMNEYVLNRKKVMSYGIASDRYHSFYSPQMISEFEKNISSI